MAHSNLPQQLDLTSEYGVQIEVDEDRKVAYLHVDGYTACRVSYKGQRIDISIKENGEELNLRSLAK